MASIPPSKSPLAKNERPAPAMASGSGRSATPLPGLTRMTCSSRSTSTTMPSLASVPTPQALPISAANSLGGTPRLSVTTTMAIWLPYLATRRPMASSTRASSSTTPASSVNQPWQTTPWYSPQSTGWVAAVVEVWAKPGEALRRAMATAATRDEIRVVRVIGSRYSGRPAEPPNVGDASVTRI